MKKTLFLFLTFSSILFGNSADTKGTQVEIVTGNNTGNTPLSTTIDINVTVNVAPREDGLLLVDANGTEIASVDFAHDLIEGNLTDQLPSEVDIKTTIYAKASYLNDNNKDSIVLPNSINSYDILGAGHNRPLNMGLTYSRDALLVENKLPINILSTVKSPILEVGTYTAGVQKFTVNFSPTGNKF